MPEVISEPDVCATCGERLSLSPSVHGHCSRCLFATTFGHEEPLEEEVSSAPWTTFSGCELYEEIGRGGMGVVYRARQSSLNRIVAVKVLLRAQFAGTEERERFFREAQAAARLKHPGIVGIYEVGEAEGVPWFSMEYISGLSLEKRVREHPLEGLEAARCVQQVALALHHAHEHGVLHRDLKPSNILLDERGTPRITDFGIARMMTSETASQEAAELTRTGQILGSPGYAAPEQALCGHADARTDVYGLGALLYHLLTGRPPFQGPTLDVILVQLRESDPLSPRRLNPTAPRDLETICLKCLHKQPEGRYASAQAVAEDLKRFLDGAAILARPLSPLGHTWRWCRRYPGTAALLAVIGLLVSALVIGAVTFARQQQRQEHRTALLAQARMHRAENVAGARTQALAALQEAWRIRSSAELQSEAAAALSLHEIRLERTLPPNDPLAKPPESGGSADGRYSVSFDNNAVVVIERATQREHARLTGYRKRPLVQLDDTGTRMAIVKHVADKMPGDITLHELPSGSVLHTLRHPQPVTCLDWAGDLLASGGSFDRLVYVWDARTGERRHRFSGHDANLEAVRFRPDGQELVSIAGDSFLRVWHAGRGVEVLRLEGKQEHRGPIWWDAEGTRLYCPRRDQRGVDVFHLEWSRVAKVLSPSLDEPRSENLPNIHLNGTGDLAAVVDERGCRVWSYRHGRLVAIYPKDPGEWMSVQLSDQTGLWLSSWNHGLRRVPLNQTEPWPQWGAMETSGLNAGALLVAHRADGQVLASTRNDTLAARDRVQLWWPEKQQRVDLPQTDPFCAALSPDGAWCVTGSFTQDHAQLWQLPEGKRTRQIEHPGIVLGAAFVDEGRQLWLWGDRAIQCLNTQDWKPLRPTQSRVLMGLTVSAEGNLAASLARQEVVLHRTSDLSELVRLPVPALAGGLGSASLSFSGDGNRLAVHTSSGVVVVWDLPELQQSLKQMPLNLKK